MTESVLSTSRVYWKFPLTGDDAGSVTVDQIQVAIGDTSAEPDSDWFDADAYDVDEHIVKLLVGPDTPPGAQSPGWRHVFCRVTDNPEQPVLYAGAIFVV